jgi:hypothetical protein
MVAAGEALDAGWRRRLRFAAVRLRLARLLEITLGWLPELALGALAAGMAVVEGFRNYPGDPDVFYKYAALVGHGQLPFRNFTFEYPPLDIIPMVLPHALQPGTPSLAIYRPLLYIQNVVLLVAIGIGVFWLARRGWSHESPLRSLVLFGLIALALEPVITWRVDTAVTALTVVALIAATGRRPIASGLALGVGVMTKLYPIALLPVLALGQVRERRWRPGILLAGAALLTIALIALALALIAGARSLYFVQYATTRGTQIESLPGALALLAAVTGGAGAHIAGGFGTMQVDSSLLPALDWLMVAVTVGGLAALGLGLWHRFRADRRAFGAFQLSSQATYLAAAGLLVLVTSRVLSPQYMFWIVPFAALVARPKALLLLVACLLTTLVYPLNYQQFVDQEPLPVMVVNVRNAILLALFCWLIWPDLRSLLQRRVASIREPLR